MTTIFYKNNELSADRLHTNVSPRSLHTRSKGPKLFVNKDKTMAIAITGPIPNNDELESIFATITLNLSKIHSNMDEGPSKIIRNKQLDFDDWSIIGITTDYTFRCSEDYPLMLMSDDLPCFQSSSTGAASVLSSIDITTSEFYQYMASIDPLVSKEHDVIHRQTLKPFKYVEIVNADHAKR